VARVWLQGDLLPLGILSGEWVDAMIEERLLRIAHERTDGEFFNSPSGGVLLIASTKDLRKFLLKYADDPRAFPKPDECRVTAGGRTGCAAVWGNPPLP
jgi:hypothetical protein